MEIVVLVKQVPDTEAMIQIAEDGVSLKTEKITWIMNPYDEFAVEEAVRIRASLGGRVTVLALGPESTVTAIRTALAMGADKGIHIHDPAAEGSDSLSTGKILAAALKDMPYDLIIAGQRAMDDDGYQVGAAVAEYLDIPQISMVIKQEIVGGKIICHRTEDGALVTVESELPVLFTTQRGLNEPRYVTFPGIIKAKKKPVEVKTLEDLGIDPQTVGPAGQKVTIVALHSPPKRIGVRMIVRETEQENAAELVRILSEEVKVLLA
jgi:electron transfer flavoprotein beta subunit